MSEPDPLTLSAHIHHELQLKDPVTLDFIDQITRCVELFDKKQIDYGPRNIGEFGRGGVLIRMNDKFARLKNLLIKDGNFDPNVKAANEAIVDTFRDIANYALIYLMLEEGTWPVDNVCPHCRNGRVVCTDHPVIPS